MADWCNGSIVDSLSTDLGSSPKSVPKILVTRKSAPARGKMGCFLLYLNGDKYV